MHTRFNYITGRTSEFDIFKDGIPVHLEAGGFLICTSGSGEVVLDSRQYTIKQWDMIVALPYSYAQAIHTTDDFDGVIFGVDIDTLINTELSNRSLYITSVATNPCVSLKQEGAEKLLHLREVFLKESKDVEHPLRSEINEAILKIIIYEVAALFSQSEPIIEHTRSRDDTIFNNFVMLLYSSESKHRSLEHFAQKQQITPSHLSKVVKRVSNRSASDWISSYTIVCIKRMLQDEDIAIATIAENLNFPNASFLTQYFKKRTGLTPRGYRAEFSG